MIDHHRRQAVLWLGLIVLAAAALRLAVLTRVQFVSFDDSRDYLTLADSLLIRHEYVVNGLCATRMPGYPVFIAAIWACWHSVSAVLNLQAVVGALCALPAYFLGRRLNTATGLAAAVFVALDPLQIGFAASVLSEIPFTLGLLVALALAARMMTDRRWGWWIVLGLLWAAAVYLRGSVHWLLAPLGLLIVFLQVLHGRQETHFERLPPGRIALRGLVGLVLAAGTLAACLAPWQIRNTQLFGPHRWLTTLEGISLYEAVYPEADGGPRQDKIAVPPEIGSLDEAGRNDAWMARARGYILNDPGRMLRLAGVKIARTWSPIFHAAEFRNPAAQAILLLWSLLTYVLALVGLRAWWRGVSPAPGVPDPTGARGALWIILLPILYFTLLHAVFQGSVRYRVPLMPLVDLLAAAGLIQLWSVFRKTPTPALIKGS
jgi:hypothetical protein